MKRILLFFLIIAHCLALFSGCKKHENPTPVELPTVPTIFPFAPPHVLVIGNMNAVNAWRGTTSWMTEGEDGIGSGIESDSPHPLECKDDLPILEITKKTTVNLKFEAAPSTITVKQYKATATDFDSYKEIAVTNSSFEIKSGNYVYEIIASWSGTYYNGTVYYAFKTEK